MVRYLFYTTGDLTYQSSLVLKACFPPTALIFTKDLFDPFLSCYPEGRYFILLSGHEDDI